MVREFVSLLFVLNIIVDVGYLAYELFPMIACDQSKYGSSIMASIIHGDITDSTNDEWYEKELWKRMD